MTNGLPVGDPWVIHRSAPGTKLMRSGDHISVVGPGVRRAQRGELQAAVAEVAASAGEVATSSTSSPKMGPMWFNIHRIP